MMTTSGNGARGGRPGRAAARVAAALALAAGALLAFAVDPASGGLGVRAEAAIGIFGYTETKREGLKPFPKWTGALQRYFEEKGQKGGNCASKEFNRCHYKKWMTFLDKVKGMSPDRQLKLVNDFMNRSRYITDPINWGLADYWATPGQFLDKFGDCEDYAIAKFLSLRALGWPADKLRIVVVQDQNLRVPHAILGVYQDGKILLLDNQITIVANANMVHHYRPIFSLSENAWWRYTPAKGGRR